MEINIINNIAVIKSNEIILSSAENALDLIGEISFNYNIRKVIMKKENISENFFDLKSKLAGEILQKFTNYRIDIAIIGDFEACKSKSLNDFIRECNKTGRILFLKTEQEAIETLTK